MILSDLFDLYLFFSPIICLFCTFTAFDLITTHLNMSDLS